MTAENPVRVDISPWVNPGDSHPRKWAFLLHWRSPLLHHVAEVVLHRLHRHWLSASPAVASVVSESSLAWFSQAAHRKREVHWTASSPRRVDRVAFLSHLPRFLLRGELAWSILPGKPHGQRERSDHAPMPTLCVSQFMLHSPPRQACLEEVGRPERFPRSLLFV